MPDAPGLELIAGELRDAHPDSVLGTYHEHGQACLIVDPEQVLAVLAWLRDTPGQEYRFLASVHGVDYLPAEPRFGVHYELLNRDRVERIRVRAALRRPGRRTQLPELDSCVELSRPPSSTSARSTTSSGSSFAAIRTCAGSCCPEVYVGWPQRRDFPIGGEPVIFTHNEHQVPGWSQ